MYALTDWLYNKFCVLVVAWDVGGQINVRNINWKDSWSGVVQLQKKKVDILCCKKGIKCPNILMDGKSTIFRETWIVSRLKKRGKLTIWI